MDPQDRMSAYPPSTEASPHLFKKVAVQGICVELNFCLVNSSSQILTSAYNLEAKQPEHVFINLFSRDEGIDQNQGQAQSQSQSQDQTVTVCPANARCVIEQ